MIQITFPDGAVREYDAGITAYDIAHQLSPALARSVVACSFDGVTMELNRPLTHDGHLTLYRFDDDEGKRTFWHTSAHLLAEALYALYPGIQFGFGPAVEAGFFYDVALPGGAQISEDDFPKIEAKMLELAKNDEPVVRREVSKAEALAFFEKEGQEYKCEHIAEDLKDGEISTYTQGAFTDLCRGPHLVSTGAIKAVKLTSIAGAFWRGDASKQQLQRLYGITFPKKSLLDDYLTMLAEAKKRDHRKIGKEMELFTFSDSVGKGLPLWLPKGTDLRIRLQEMLRTIQRRYGYQEVITPHIGGKALYVTSGHYAHYGKDSFQPIHTPDDDEEYMLKPMNCPHHCEIYASRPRSYRELPFRCAEFGTVYRYEKSGELHGLTRVRSFTQDDAHIFCRHDQVKGEFLRVLEIIQAVFRIFGFDDDKVEFQISLRDPANTEKYIGSDALWQQAEQAIIDACKERGLTAKEVKGEAAFYGPKLDCMVRDAIGRRWQLGTIQVDYNLPQRFHLEYTAEDNSKQTPVMIHRAPFGSLERFIAVLIEHTAGHFPLWLSPEQVAILPISEKYNDYAGVVLRRLTEEGIRAFVDDRNEKVGRKIRDNELQRVPYMLVVGEKEAATDSVAMRQQGGGEQATLAVAAFIQRLHDEVATQLAAMAVTPGEC